MSGANNPFYVGRATLPRAIEPWPRGRRTERGTPAGLLTAAVAAVAAGCALTGCSSLSGDGGSLRPVALAEFSQPAPRGTIIGSSPATAGASALNAVDEAIEVEPEPATADEAEGAASSRNGMTGMSGMPGSRPLAESAGATTSVPKPGPVTQPPPSAPPPAGTDEAVGKEGSVWIVDALVGQINGRPIFAQEFFEPREAQLIKLANAPDRLAGFREAQMLIEARFQEMVNSELIISEAEGQLTPEQQQGFFAWVKSLQEGTIAEFSGSREEAKERLLEEEGRDLEEFIRDRRDRSLVQYLLDKKVKPRTIVAWRDIEREYLVRGDEFNPPPLVSVGRIALNARTQPELAAKIKERIQSGKTFTEIASEFGTELRLERGGIIAVIPVKQDQDAAGAIEGSDLAPMVKTNLRGLTPGALSPATERGDSISWFAIAEVRQDPPRSLYDPDVQIRLRRELDAIRGEFEQARYIQRLRSRWVTDDIDIVLNRLQEIALERYWRK